MANRAIFTVKTVLGDTIVLKRDRWKTITRYKHPAAEGHEEDVEECLRHPEIIRESTKDPTVHLYYRTMANGRVLCVVTAPSDVTRRFVMTVYFTDRIKEGPALWPK